MMQEFEKSQVGVRQNGFFGDSKETCHEYLGQVKSLKPRLGPPLQHRLALLVVCSTAKSVHQQVL